MDPAAIEADPDTDNEVLQDWSALAGTVAAMIAGAGGELEWPLSGYLRLVVHHLGSWYGSFWHAPSAGEVPESVAAVFGPQVALHLVFRDLLGLSWPEFPSFGWLSNAELRAVPEVSELPASVDEDAEEDVWTLIDAIEKAASTGKDLISIYG